MKGRRWRALAALGAAIGAIACIDITVDTKALGSVQVVNRGDSIVVAGDTLRNASGDVAPLDIKVFNAGGDVIAARSIQFVTIDTVRVVATDTPRSRVSVTPNGLVVARSGVTGTAKLYVVVDSALQSVLQSIDVVPKPESLALSTALRDTINYRTRATDPYDTSGAVSVRVAAAASANVPKWVVTFSLEKASDSSPVNDTSLYAIVTDAGVVSNVARTDANGVASRRVRFKGIPGTTLIDSVYLVARARFRKAELRGSPKRVFLLVKPAPTS